MITHVHVHVPPYTSLTSYVPVHVHVWLASEINMYYLDAVCRWGMLLYLDRIFRYSRCVTQYYNNIWIGTCPLSLFRIWVPRTYSECWHILNCWAISLPIQYAYCTKINKKVLNEITRHADEYAACSWISNPVNAGAAIRLQLVCQEYLQAGRWEIWHDIKEVVEDKGELNITCVNYWLQPWPKEGT